MIAISVGLPDHCKLVVTVIKEAFQKNLPKEIIYRNYKQIKKQTFNKELKFKTVLKHWGLF